MIFVELFAPAGTLTPRQRRRIGEELVTAVVPEQEGAPPESVESARAFTQVVVHEPEMWIAGGNPPAPAEASRYLVRVSLPGSWRKEIAPIIIPAITDVLARAEADSARLYDEPRAWVQVVGIAEGSYGLFGRVMGSTDIVRTITESYRRGAGSGRAEDIPQGMALDPVCGMVVSLTDAAGVVQDGDVTYAFCGSACHAVYEQDRRAAAP